MHLRLVLPSLLSLPRDVLAASAALATMTRRAPPPRHEARGLDAVLLAAALLPLETPMAPLAAHGAGITIESGFIARADPIAMVAGRDDVLLGGRVDDLSADDAQAFVSLMNDHFASDGLRFVAARPDTWFVQFVDIAAPQSTSLAQVHGAIHAHLPQGPQGARWKRWLSEMQMLLHEDARNVARERAGQAPVTGLWIADAGSALRAGAGAAAAAAAGSGAGNSCGSGSGTNVHWFAPAGRTGDVTRGLAALHNSAAPTPPATLAQLPTTPNAVVILPQLHTATDLQAAADAWLSPALAALDRGAITELTVAADDGHDAFVWLPRTVPWWSRWRRTSASVFVPPVVPHR